MTRFYNNVVSGRLLRIKFKTQFLRQNFLSMLCFLLLGFLSGNLFGTILNSLRNWLKWDGFIIVGLIINIEAISYFSYNTHGRIRRNNDKLRDRLVSTFFCLNPITKENNKASTKKRLSFKKPYRLKRNILNFYKIGIMVGFFVDAFKVGS